MRDCETSVPLVFGFREYRNHTLVFLIVLFLGLTFAHPAITMNDDWITANQLHQLHEGHQIIVNEGKYGVFENGTLSAYFTSRSNLLGYSLFLPLISLPSLWLVNLFGDHFVFFILYLWTAVAFTIILVPRLLFPDCSSPGNRHWIFAGTGMVFTLFFINLFYYIPFLTGNSDSSPEVMAVVFTNILLFAITGVLVYELNRTLFSDTLFTLFGTTICLFNSSYFFWTTGCKDHILTLTLFTGIILCMIKYQKTRDSWFLPLAFLITGLLAWARPELALWGFLALGAFWGYSIIPEFRDKQSSSFHLLAVSPLFTLLGALPFFFNNYLVMKNPLLPTGALYLQDASTSAIMQTSRNFTIEGGTVPGISLFRILTIKNPVPSSDVARDIFGILFHPQNGSMGVLSLTPLFLVMALVAVILVLSGKLQCSGDGKMLVMMMAFIALTVFFAYSNNLPQLNTSRGIAPDVRYLLPIYIPLNLIGLLIMHKLSILAESALGLLKKIMLFCLFGIPTSIILMSFAYANPSVALNLNAPLAYFFSVLIYFVAALTLVVLLACIFRNFRKEYSYFLIALLCSLPFIWQIDALVYSWQFATAEGYPPWIPLVRVLYTWFSFPLTMH